MAMNNRLLRPRAAGGYDAAARAYFAAVATADGQQLETAVKNAINAFIVGCKRDGTWSAIKASCILMGARTLAGALTPLVGSAPTNNGPFVSGDYNRKTGLIGNATTKYLDSGRGNATDPQDSQHIAVYVSFAHTSGSGGYIGAGGFSTGASTIQVNTTANTLSFRSRTLTASTASSAAATTGFMGVSRVASTGYTRRISASDTAVTATSETSYAENVEVFNRGRASNLPSDARIAFYSVGEGLTLSLLGPRVATLYTAIGAAIP
jgi:hypothetical protein